MQIVFSPKCSLRIFPYNFVSIVCLPFAYNGSCATIVGAGEVYNRAKRKYHSTLAALLYKPKIDQSPIQYFSEIFDVISKSNIANTIFIGENHLSVLPLHRYSKCEKICSIILDAHRDYCCDLQDIDYSHANFLNYFDDLSSTIIYDYRNGNDEQFRNCQAYNQRRRRKLFLSISRSSAWADVFFGLACRFTAC